MSALREKEFNFGINVDEPPTKKLISDGDVFIKHLAEKQRNTSISLQEHLNNPKEFTKATELVPLANYNPGTSTLDSFQKTAKHFDQVEMLQAAGLNEDDIQLYFDSLEGFSFLFEKHKNWERSLLKRRLDDITEIIKSYTEKKLSVSEISSKELGRYGTVEYGLAVKPNSIETKLLKFALDNQKEKEKSAIPYPINYIKQIEENCFAHINEPPLPTINKIRRKARKLSNRITNASNTIKTMEENNRTKMPLKNASLSVESKWDVTVKTESRIESVKNKVYTCLPQNYYTVKNGEITKLNREEIETKELQTGKKLTVEEIKMLPKFQNYEPGNPSKVLYLKNLSGSVKEEQLRQLFKNHDKNENVTYKLMNGKMRGQAFVTFPDENVAKQALDEFNGIVIGNKPLIIEYGRKN